MALTERRIVFRVAVAAVMVAALGLSACGRKGALEPPPGSAVTQTTDGKPANPGPQRPQRSFFLDGLL